MCVKGVKGCKRLLAAQQAAATGGCNRRLQQAAATGGCNRRLPVMRSVFAQSQRAPQRRPHRTTSPHPTSASRPLAPRPHHVPSRAGDVEEDPSGRQRRGGRPSSPKRCANATIRCACSRSGLKRRSRARWRAGGGRRSGPWRSCARGSRRSR